MENEKKGNNEMSIELNPEVAGGTYSNLAIITQLGRRIYPGFRQYASGNAETGGSQPYHHDSETRQETSPRVV